MLSDGSHVAARVSHHAPGRRNGHLLSTVSSKRASGPTSFADEGPWNDPGHQNASMSSLQLQRMGLTRNPHNLEESHSIEWLIASGGSNGTSHYLVRNRNRVGRRPGSITWPLWHTGCTTSESTQATPRETRAELTRLSARGYTRFATSSSSSPKRTRHERPLSLDSSAGASTAPCCCTSFYSRAGPG